MVSRAGRSLRARYGNRLGAPCRIPYFDVDNLTIDDNLHR